jgi:hypothetical protein
VEYDSTVCGEGKDDDHYRESSQNGQYDVTEPFGALPVRVYIDVRHGASRSLVEISSSFRRDLRIKITWAVKAMTNDTPRKTERALR